MMMAVGELTQALRLAIMGALVTALFALPSIGRLLSKRQVTRGLGALNAAALVFVAGKFAQHILTDPRWVILSVRVQITALLSWVPTGLWLVALTTTKSFRPHLYAATSSVALVPWLGEVMVADEVFVRAAGSSGAHLAAQSGPIFPVVAVYGLAAGAYIGVSLWRHTDPATRRPRQRRIAATAFALVTASLVSDVMLFARWTEGGSLSDIGISVAVLLMVGGLQAQADSDRKSLEHDRAEVVDEIEAVREELELALENTLNLISALPDTILLHRQGQLEFINPAGRRWLGLSDAPVGTPIAQFVAPCEERSEPSPLLAEHPPTTSFEERFVTSDGRTLLGEVRALRLMHDGFPMNMAIIRDLTARRELEQQLLTADRLSSLGTLAAGVGHEINNPLTYITSNIALARGDAESEEMREMLDDAYEGVRRVARIVEGLSTFARRRRTSDTRIDLAKAIDTSVELVRHQIRHVARIELDIPDALPEVAGTQDDIIQVLVNVLINAGHAIEAAPKRDHAVSVSVTHDETHVRLCVDDTGCGIKPEDQKRLLEPFFTTKPVGKGTGLGLSICHGIIEGMHGRLTIEGREVGAQVAIQLPLRAPARAEDAEVPTTTTLMPPPPRHGLNVLVVDDDPMVRRSLRRALKQQVVTLADDGENGLDACAHATFDLILCDVMMPGISGTEFLQRLTQRDPAQAERVILITGGVFTAEERARIDALGARVLQKPISPAQLACSLAQTQGPTDGACAEFAATAE